MLVFVRRKWFLADIGHEGLNKLLAAYPDKSAEAVCTFGYSEGPGHNPVIFQGKCPVSGIARIARHQCHSQTMCAF